MPAGWLGAKASDCNVGEQGSSPALGWPIQSGDAELGRLGCLWHICEWAWPRQVRDLHLTIDAAVNPSGGGGSRSRLFY